MLLLSSLLSLLLLSSISLLYSSSSGFRVASFWRFCLSLTSRIGRRRLLFLLGGFGYPSTLSCFCRFLGNSSVLLTIMLMCSLDELWCIPKSCFSSMETVLFVAASTTAFHSSFENNRYCRAYSQHLNICNHLTNLSSSLAKLSEAWESLSRREWQHLQNDRSR